MNGVSDPSSGPNPGLASWYVPGRADGFGDRLQMYDNAGTPSLELLRFHPDIALAPGFEEKLRDRVRELRTFRHPSFTTVRSVQHLEGDGLALVSAYEPGQRLSELFDHHPRKPLHPGIVTWMLKELTPALAALHEQGPGVAHGALTPDRIVLSPEGRLCIVEHVMGSALAQLRRPPARLWREFGLLASPHGKVAAELDARTDIVQLAGVALSMLLTRRVSMPEIEERLPALLEELGRTRAPGTAHQIEPLQEWLERALQRSIPAYNSAADAIADLKALPTADAVSVAVPAPPPPAPAPRPAAATAPPVTAERRPAPPAPAADRAPRGARTPPRREERQSHRTGLPSLLDDDWSPDTARDAFRSEQSPQPYEQPVLRVRQPLDAGQPSVLRAPRPVAPEEAPRRQPARPASTPIEAKPGSNTVHARLDSFNPPAAQSRWQDVAQAPRQRSDDVRGLGPRLSVLLCALATFEAVVIVLLALRTPTAPAIVPTVMIESAIGDTVLINGRPAGTAPVELRLDGDVRSLRIESAASSGAAPAAGTNPIQGDARSVRGFVRITADADLRVRHRGVTIGRTANGALVLPVGLQQIELVNDATGFRETRTVDVRAGEERTLRVAGPAR